MNILVHNFLHIVDYKPQKIIILINCILNYIRVTSNEKITEVILEEITKTRPTCSRLYFLYQAVNYEVIPYESIIPYIQSPEYFFWFAPFVEKFNHQLFENFMNQQEESLIISSIENMREDNWKLHKQFASKGMNHHEVAFLIRNDSIEKLKKIPHFNINTRLPSSPFESIDILNHGCTPLHYAIYFNSEKCYHVMIDRGASPYATDFIGFDSIYFAIAGENYSFLEEFLMNSSSESHEFFITKVKQAIQYSAKYHQNIIIDDLINKFIQFADISVIFLSAAFSDNINVILKCIDNGVDVNCCNNCGESALIIAANNNHYKLVEFLLSIPSIYLSHVDVFGRNPLICAVDKGNLNIVKLLINDHRININAYDNGIF